MVVKRFLIAVCLILPLINVSCSSERNISSNWSDNEIVIDGNISDWRNSLDTLKEYKALPGIKNNQNEIIICLATPDFRQALRILRNDFIIWYKPGASSGKTIGVKYPLQDILNEEQNEYKYMAFIPGKDKPDLIIQKLMKEQDEIQLLNENQYPLTLLPLNNTEGIKAALGFRDSLFVYEISMPLKQTNNNTKFNIDAKPGEILTISFENEEKNFGRPGEGGPPMGSGFPGQSNPGGNKMGKRPPGKIPDMPFEEPAKALNFSVTVTLHQGKI